MYDINMQMLSLTSSDLMFCLYSFSDNQVSINKIESKLGGFSIRQLIRPNKKVCVFPVSRPSLFFPSDPRTFYCV